MPGYLITFPNTHSAIMGEKALLAGGIDTGVMPMPAAISAGCGICLRITAADLDRARALLGECGVSAEGWYDINGEGESLYRRIE